MEKKFYSVKEFVNVIGEGTISKASIYKHIKDGSIPVAYIGNRALIPADWVEEFCNSAKANVVA